MGKEWTLSKLCVIKAKRVDKVEGMRLEAAQSQAEVSRTLQVAQSRSPGSGSPNKKPCHQEGQPRSPHRSTSAQDRYLALSA
ncbi:hypothetical protein TNCV_4746281 [Trichonephila clavipes]|nr:hypothetical protein TNCV_4746281 [Trichonephila clavipes]